jgi:GST-like protein
MIKFFYNAGPNPTKVALFLEEAGVEYGPVPVDTRKSDQHQPEFLALNPNAKVPVIVDGDVTIFDSSAILLYLAEKTGHFLPNDSATDRGQMLSWLMFVASGLGPYSGQAAHFLNHAPEKLPYAVNRYRFEVIRHFGILEAHLDNNAYMVGNAYSIVDMSVWGWARMLPRILGKDALVERPNLKRLLDEIDARPATGRALALKDQHEFKAEMDDAAKRAMFPQNYAA